MGTFYLCTSSVLTIRKKVGRPINDDFAWFNVGHHPPHESASHGRYQLLHHTSSESIGRLPIPWYLFGRAMVYPNSWYQPFLLLASRASLSGRRSWPTTFYESSYTGGNGEASLISNKCSAMVCYFGPVGRTRSCYS